MLKAASSLKIPFYVYLLSCGICPAIASFLWPELCDAGAIVALFCSAIERNSFD